MLIPVESMQQKPLYVVNGGIKMPIGWRFLPTDEEVLVHYLKQKELGLPYPAGVIPEIDDIFNTEPWNLPGCLNEDRYFFSRLKASDVMNSDKKRRFAGSGYWETNGKMKLVQSVNQLVGMRKKFIFSYSTTTSTQWVMHELQLLGQMELEYRWAIYRLYQRESEPGREQSNPGREQSLVTLQREPRKHSNHRVYAQPSLHSPSSSPSYSSGDDHFGPFTA